MKILLSILLIQLLFSCNSEPAKYNFSNVSLDEKKIEYNVDCNRTFPSGIKTQALINGVVLFENELVANQLSERISFEIYKLPVQLLTQLTAQMVLNDSIKVEIRLIDNKSTILSQKEAYILSPKSKLLSEIELTIDGSHYSISEKNLFDEEYNAMLLDYYRFNKVYLNRIEGFSPKIRVKTSKENLSFGIQLSSNYKYWIEDVNKKKFKLIDQTVTEEYKGKSYSILTIPENSNLNGIIHLVIEDLRTKILYTLPLYNLDNIGPTLSLSTEFSEAYNLLGLESSGELSNLYNKNNENEGYGYVKISHGEWESNGWSSPIALKIFVTGDVEKVYFDGKLIPFRKNKSKYHTVNVNTHVGINSFEVKAIDSRGNISTDDYIIKAVSIKNDNPIINNNIENNINLDNE